MISRRHSPDYSVAVAVRLALFPDHHQLVRALLLFLHRIPRLCR